MARIELDLKECKRLAMKKTMATSLVKRCVARSQIKKALTNATGWEDVRDALLDLIEHNLI